MAHIFTPALRRPLSKPFAKSGTRTLIQRAIASLRARGSDAHLWLPGVGTLSGLQTGNYLESTGNTLGTVDNPTGLVLDALGSVGAELVVNGDFSNGTTGFYSVASTLSVASNELCVTSSGAGGRGVQGITYTANKSYRVTVTARPGTSGTQTVTFYSNGYANNIQFTAVNGTVSGVFVPTTSGIGEVWLGAGTSGTAYFDNISVREVSGIHLTQSTTANKPIVQRGLWNLLTYSSDFGNAAWVTEGTASKVGNVLNMPASPGDDVYHGTLLPAGTYTNAFVLSGSGTISLFCYNPTDNIFAVKQITLTATPTIYVNVASPTVANNVYYFGRRTGDTATSVTFGGGGLFQGTLTASQILAAGGIPVTTTAAGSNPDSGRYAWKFDGSNDSLALGSVPFQMGDDFAVVCAVEHDAPAGWATMFAVTGATATPRIQMFLNNDTGAFGAYLRDDSGAFSFPSGVADLRGSKAVLTMCKRGTAVYLRVNKVQIATASTASLGVATLTLAAIGFHPSQGGDYMRGRLYFLTANKGTFSDADLALEESLAASAAGITI